MAQSSQRASRSGDLLSHMFVLGKKTIDSVNCLISGTLGTSAAFSAGAWEIFFSKALGTAWALLSEPPAGQCELLAHLEVLCHGWEPRQELGDAEEQIPQGAGLLGAGAQLQWLSGTRH